MRAHCIKKRFFLRIGIIISLKVGSDFFPGFISIFSKAVDMPSPTSNSFLEVRNTGCVDHIDKSALPFVKYLLSLCESKLALISRTPH